VVDIDLSGRLSSSERNAGGVRATWWQPVNITLCRASIKYYEACAKKSASAPRVISGSTTPRPGPRPRSISRCSANWGHPIEELDRPPRSIAGCPKSIGSTELPAQPSRPRTADKFQPAEEHYRARSRTLGAEYLDRLFVHAIEAGETEVRIGCWLADDALLRRNSHPHDCPRMPAGEAATGHLVELNAGAVAITGGAWSPSALKLVGLKNLSEPIRRQICLVDNRATNLEAYGMVVDTSGVYFHNDGAYILAGYSPPEEPAGYHFKYDGERFFMDEIWPRLFARMSAFERLRHVRGWAGCTKSRPTAAQSWAARRRVYSRRIRSAGAA